MKGLVLVIIVTWLVFSTGSAVASPLVYVAHPNDGKVSLIDMATGASLATITVAGAPRFIALTPDGQRAYVANGTSAIPVIDTASNTVTKTISVYGPSRHVAVSPDGTRVYVVVDPAPDHLVVAIDTATDKVVATIPIPVSKNYLNRVAVAPDSKYVYAAHWEGVSVIDTSTDTVVATIPLAGDINSVVTAPDGTRAYALLWDGAASTQPSYGGIAAIGVASNTVVAFMGMTYPLDLVVTPDSRWLYAIPATNSYASSSTTPVFDTATNTYSRSVYGVGAGATAVAAVGDGSAIYIAIGQAPYRVAVVNTATNVVTDTVATPFSPYGMAIMPASTRVIRVTGDLAFGNVNVGTTSARTLTISNTGTEPLTVSGIDYPTGFSGPWSGTIPSRGSQAVTVTFAPVAASTYGGAVTVNADHTSGTNTIGALGTGTVAAATRVLALTGDLAFGYVHLGTTATRTLTISNIGTAPLTVSSISYPAGFSGPWSGTIVAGGSQAVTVTFAPTTATSYGGTLTVYADQTSGVSTLPASGAGQNGQLLVPGSLLFLTQGTAAPAGCEFVGTTRLALDSGGRKTTALVVSVYRVQ